jgi:hypothetical protein
MGQRIGPDGLPADDVLVNPKYLERIDREAQERRRIESESNSPWSRGRVEKALAIVAAQGSVGVVNGRPIKGAVDFHGADLSGLDLSGLDLSNANLHGANLSGSKMTGCRLVGANLHEANLTGAALDGVNAVEANFHGACLCKADVTKTHFMKANLYESCHEATVGLDLQEKPMTPAEVAQARYRQSEGFRANVSVDEGLVRYYGDTLKDSNVTGMASVCKRKR